MFDDACEGVENLLSHLVAFGERKLSELTINLIVIYSIMRLKKSEINFEQFTGIFVKKHLTGRDLSSYIVIRSARII